MIQIKQKTIYNNSKRLQNQFNSNVIEARIGEEIVPVKWIRKAKLTPKQQNKKAHVNQKPKSLSSIIKTTKLIRKLWLEALESLRKSH